MRTIIKCLVLMLPLSASAIIVGDPPPAGGTCMLRDLFPADAVQSEIAAGKWLMVGYIESPTIFKLSEDGKADITFQRNVQCVYGMASEMRMSVWWRCKKGFEAECLAAIVRANKMNKGVK